MYRPASISSFVFAGSEDFAHPVDGDLPQEAPLAMPVQTFAEAPTTRSASLPDPILGRRLFLILGSLAIGLLAAREMALPLIVDGMNLWDAMMAALSFALFGWISFGFLSALAGFWVLMGAGPGLPRQLVRSRPPIRRTAILVPIYNEAIGPVFGRLEIMAKSIEAIGLSHLFDMFVLSDSREQAEPVERGAFRRLRMRASMAIYYRRRPANIARKPGNIAEWVQRFGGAYEHMIVLDADSLMSGIAMARLAATMEANKHVGLIQTVPALHNACTLFARWQQFASTIYGPVTSAGLRWWSGSEATFWGHNAIIRVRAFAESCGLPTLSGREPFGGHIMSHDMVEAALLRRRGWSVHMISLPDGSYEECPPTLPDLALRDRRWCQGNLQHLRLIGSAGFHWVNRLQLLMGASAYLASPLWLLLLLASLIEPFRPGLARWAIMPSGWLMMLTMILLLGPKILALAWLSVDHRLREALGGSRRVIASVAIEIPLSILIAPLTMLTQTLAIIDIARGRPSGWATQRREADGIAFADVWLRYRLHVALGLIFCIAIVIGIGGTRWTLPVAISLISAPWVAMISARIDLGDRLAAWGLFLAPNESHHVDQRLELHQPSHPWTELLRPRSEVRLLKP